MSPGLMPMNSTRRPGAMTSRMPLSGGADDVAAGLAVLLELDEALLLGLLEEIGERAEAIVRFIEAGVAPLERLLDHRAPDLLVGAALGGERLERAEHQLVGLLLLVGAAGGGRRVLALLRAAPLLLVGTHQVVVVDELVAVVDEEIRARVLHPHADHGL